MTDDGSGNFGLVQDFLQSAENDVLNGLTPVEVINSKIIDKDLQHLQIQTARNARVTKNKEQKWCNYIFKPL
jgi:hypothetical protein